MPPVPIQGWVLHAIEKEVTLEAGVDGQQVAVEVDLVEGEGRLEGEEAAHTTHPASSSRPPT